MTVNELIRGFDGSGAWVLEIGPGIHTPSGVRCEHLNPAQACRSYRLPDNSFSLILLSCLEALYDPFSASKQVDRVLAPSGYLVITRSDSAEAMYLPTRNGLRQLFPGLREIAANELEWVAQKPATPKTAARMTSVRFDTRLFELDFPRLQRIYEAEIQEPYLAPALADVLRWREDQISVSLRNDGERAFPGEERFQKGGYFRMMLGRYAFAGSQLCAGAQVLDSCCGLGWGSRMIAPFARQVTAFDRDEAAVDFCRKAWPAANIRWAVADALDLEEFGRGQYDVVLGMETIEHFSRVRGELYVREVERALACGGVFAGTSAFPESAQEARALEAGNRHHLYIYTRAEMLDLLLRYFSRASIIGDWFFLAMK